MSLYLAGLLTGLAVPTTLLTGLAVADRIQTRRNRRLHDQAMEAGMHTVWYGGAHGAINPPRRRGWWR